MELPQLSKLCTSLPSAFRLLTFSHSLLFIAGLIFLKVIVPVCSEALPVYCLKSRVKAHGRLNMPGPSWSTGCQVLCSELSGCFPFPLTILSGPSHLVQLLPPPLWSLPLWISDGGHSSAPRSSSPLTLIRQSQSPNFLCMLCFVLAEPLVLYQVLLQAPGYRMRQRLWTVPSRSFCSAVLSLGRAGETGDQNAKGISDSEGVWRVLFSSVCRYLIMRLKH